MGVAGIEAGRRPLPTTPKERDEALALNELPAGMIISSISAVMKAAEVKPLDAVEAKEGKMAFSALLYEYGAQLSAAALLVMWMMAVMTPRVIEWFEKRKKQQPASINEAVRQAQLAEAHANLKPVT